MNTRVTLRPGDYVSTHEMTDEQYEQVRQAFENAGYLRYWPERGKGNGDYLECDDEHLVSTSILETDGERLLTIGQVVNATNAQSRSNHKMNEWFARGIGGCTLESEDSNNNTVCIKDYYGHLHLCHKKLLTTHEQFYEEESISRLVIILEDTDELADYEVSAKAIYEEVKEGNIPGLKVVNSND